MENTAKHEMGHVIAVIALYRSPPQVAYVSRSGHGHVKWQFQVSESERDSIIYASGAAADLYFNPLTAVMHSDDVKSIESMGYSVTVALEKARSIIQRNSQVLVEHWSFLMPRDGKLYRLASGKSMQFLVDMVW